MSRARLLKPLFLNTVMANLMKSVVFSSKSVFDEFLLDTILGELNSGLADCECVTGPLKSRGKNIFQEGISAPTNRTVSNRRCDEEARRGGATRRRDEEVRRGGVTKRYDEEI